MRSTLIPSAAKTASNAAVNLLSRSRIRNRSWPTRSSRSMSRLRACWVTHSPCRMRRHPEQVDPAGCDLDREQDVHPPQQDRVHGAEVHSDHTGGLGLQE